MHAAWGSMCPGPGSVCVIAWELTQKDSNAGRRTNRCAPTERSAVFHLHSSVDWVKKWKRKGVWSGRNKDTLFCLQVTTGMRHGLRGGGTLRHAVHYESSNSETSSELWKKHFLLQQQRGKLVRCGCWFEMTFCNLLPDRSSSNTQDKGNVTHHLPSARLHSGLIDHCYGLQLWSSNLISHVNYLMSCISHSRQWIQKFWKN